MLTDALRELFALINLACGAGILLLLLAYLVRARERRLATGILLLLAVFVCLLNSVAVYYLR